MEVFMSKLTVTLVALAALIIGTVSINALTPSTAQAQAANCIDLTKPENITISWPDRKAKPGTVTVKSAQKLPACKDGTIWFSAFSLPTNYDNSGWFGVDPSGKSHPTSYPQKATAHTRIDVKAGAVLAKTVTVAEVNLCKTAAQYDVYYRKDKITDIKTEKGIFEHSGVSWAAGFVAVKETGKKCEPTPEKPTPVVTEPPKVTNPPVVETPAEVPVQPVAETPAEVTELPQTGIESTGIIAVIAALLTSGVVYLVRRNG